MGTKTHWDTVYANKSNEHLSWNQVLPANSLALIESSGLGTKARFLDIGGGTSSLIRHLLARGYDKLTVVDISEIALKKTAGSLGTEREKVRWLEADVTKMKLLRASYDLWHDRAVFHFLTDPEDRKHYIAQMEKALDGLGYAIVATFSLDGPTSCSGLPVIRYSPDSLSREIGRAFSLRRVIAEDHITPLGSVQKFIYCLFQGKRSS